MIPIGFNQLSSSQRVNRFFFISAILSVLLFTSFFNPEQLNLVPCYFHELTGHSCPSCGLSRSFYALSHLNFQKSVHFHPLGIVIYFTLLMLLLKSILEIILGTNIKLSIKSWVNKFLIGGLLFIWMGWWIVRLLLEG